MATHLLLDTCCITVLLCCAFIRLLYLTEQAANLSGSGQDKRYQDFFLSPDTLNKVAFRIWEVTKTLLGDLLNIVIEKPMLVLKTADEA